ncbi:AMP-binding protein, partial [Nocardioides sp. R-C-SC26]|uniref:AMP-binding protein n=1 Tax=Nocardioides sp. R-C-SC26 TaxID=2870414 RepID=UPI001E357B5F
ATPAPAAGMPTPTGDDVFMMYTGGTTGRPKGVLWRQDDVYVSSMGGTPFGTTGMPKGVLWRQDDVYVSSMGGTPFGTTEPSASYEAIATHAASGAGRMTLLMIPPFMHAAAQWSTFHMITGGGTIVLPDNVHTFDPADALTVAARERCVSIPVIGDAIALPLIEEVERGDYDLSALGAINNGAAPLSPSTRARILATLPNIFIMDAAGASETGLQMSSLTAAGMDLDAGVFTPQGDTAVLDETMTRVLGPGEGGGWLARRDKVPLGYLGDAEKTARIFPEIDGVRWSVPGDRADVLPDGRIRLLGRDSVTINSGGEKIFAEEVESAVMAHPAVRDVVCVGRPSERWGSEVVAIVQLVDDAAVSDEELIAVAGEHVARYKLPKAILRVPVVQRSPSGKADYRWAKAQV